MIEGRAHALRIGGLTPLSTVDYPGQLAAVIFCQGCPWCCSYCHNTHLQPRRAPTQVDWSEVLHFLARRRGLLDAVVFSGGEPTLQSGVADAMSQVRDMGYRVGLHTAGIAPRRLQRLLPLCDWVALDIKAPPAAYARITGRAGSGKRAWDSLRRVLDSGVAYEIRTTVHASLLPDAALPHFAQALAAAAVRHYVLQEFRAAGCANAALIEAGSRLNDASVAAMAKHLPALTVRRGMLS